MQEQNRKIFRALLIAHLTLTIFPVIFTAFFMIKNGRGPAIDFAYFILSFLFVVLNDTFVLYLLNTKKGITRTNSNRKLLIFSVTICIVVLIAQILLFCYGASEEFSKTANRYNRDPISIGKVILIYLFLIIAAGIGVAIMQIKYIRLISKLKKTEIDELVEHIGETQSNEHEGQDL